MTFSDKQETDEAKINGFIDKLWETTGFDAQKIKKPYGRIVRHTRDSKHEDILKEVLDLLPTKTINEIN